MAGLVYRLRPRGRGTPRSAGRSPSPAVRPAEKPGRVSFPWETSAGRRGPPTCSFVRVIGRGGARAARRATRTRSRRTRGSSRRSPAARPSSPRGGAARASCRGRLSVRSAARARWRASGCGAVAHLGHGGCGAQPRHLRICTWLGRCHRAQRGEPPQGVDVGPAACHFERALARAGGHCRSGTRVARAASSPSPTLRACSRCARASPVRPERRGASLRPVVPDGA